MVGSIRQLTAQGVERMRQDFARILIACAAVSGVSPATGAVFDLMGAVSEGTSSTGEYSRLYDWHTALLP